MKINLLNREEKNRTRRMWEEIFTEDSPEFLDYYYREKNADNEILTLEESVGDVSMLHLNPYLVRLGALTTECHYIVAVATDPNYRHRGYMAMLLKEAMKYMYDREEPFTFLMPASEDIYLPFDFRFIYGQKQIEITGETSGEWLFREAESGDARLLGELASGIIGKSYHTVAVRDEAYYRRQILEQKSENGGIRIAMKEGDVLGLFSYGKEENTFEIMEPLVQDSICNEQFLKEAVYSLTKDEITEVTCRGLMAGGSREKPMIMARIVHLEKLLEALVPVCDFCMELSVLDPILDENTGVFRLTSDRGRISVEKVRKKVEEMEAIPVSVLVQILFGYGHADFQHFIRPLSPVFLNEVV